MCIYSVTYVLVNLTGGGHLGCKPVVCSSIVLISQQAVLYI